MDAEERFQYYYGEYSARMLQIAGRNGIPQDEMEDLLQETFLSFYVHYFPEVPEGCVMPLLCRIMKNRCIDYWRKKENRVSDAATPDELAEALTCRSGMTGRDTLDIVIENLLFEEFSRAVFKMRDEWKYVYVLYELMGHPMNEISRMLGITESACRMRNSRGKHYLAEYMREQEKRSSG